MLKVVDTYEKGAVADIRKYDGIFRPYPDPISWNTEIYGSGVEFRQNDKYVVDDALVLYGQYDLISCFYHFFDGAREACQMHVGEEIIVDGNLGTEMVPGFKYWIMDGIVRQPDERVNVSATVHFTPFAEFEWKLTYFGNGASDGKIDPVFGVEKRTVELVDGRYVDVRNCETTKLAENPYTRTGYEFVGWTIDGERYYPGEEFELNRNADVFAEWKKIRNYPLNVKLRYENNTPEEADETSMFEHEELEYLQSDGTQWLDFGVFPDKDVVVQLKISPKSVGNGVLFGCRPEDSELGDFRLHNQSERVNFVMGSGGIAGGQLEIDQIAELEIGNNYVKNLETGETISTGEIRTDETFRPKIGATFKLNYDDKFKKVDSSCVVWYVKIIKNDVVLNYFVPVRTA